ncbi:monovalent cation/H(+) antiporter subunit G [Geofilum sp. OHC36d9]|uniref:monovalent cation/H(+) antiporter subunit G n=1 Tax=Geofilum sp. OHC36d9 TaxID=3458413 RepID=UPI004033188B
MIEIIIGVLVLISALIVLIASIGIVRFNNLYARMHVVTKVTSFGLLTMLIAVNLLFSQLWVLIESIVIFHVLIFLSPISAHVIAKVSAWLETNKIEDKSFNDIEKPMSSSTKDNDNIK